MGSESPLRIPVIDLCDLEEKKAGSPAWNSAKSQVMAALEEYGCFEASSFTNVPLELRKSLMSSLHQLFDLPLETKLRNNSHRSFGYIGQLPAVPLYESFEIPGATDSDQTDRLTSILWPEGKPDFSKSIQQYSDKLSELDRMIRRMIFDGLGMEKYLDEHLESSTYSLRAMKYGAPETTDTQVGLGSHTDTSLLTILYQEQVGGLQIQTKTGEWINVQPSQHSFIVMTGDPLYAWTNGRVGLPFHRVMRNDKEVRFTVGLFSFPKAGYIVKAPDELVDQQHPLLFKPFDFSEFSKFHGKNKGLKEPLKTYCGA